MPKNFYSFENYKVETDINEMFSTTHTDFQTVAPQFFNNGFYLGNSWFKRWMTKNNFAAETNKEDYNFLNIIDSDGNWIGAYHQYKGRIFTNLTLQQLNESEELDLEDFDAYDIVESTIEETAKLNKLYKELAKVAGEMKSLAAKYKDGDKSVVSKLKELTPKKRKLEMEIEDEVGELDDQYDESAKD